MNKFIRLTSLLLVLALGFLYILKNPDLGIYQKSSPNHTISVEDAYKLCNKTGCISTPVTIDAFMIDSSGVGVLTDAKKTNGYIQAGQTISLAPTKRINLVEMYNFLNKNGYFLGNGILKIQVKGTLEYTPILLDRLEDHVTLHFTMEDFKIIAQNGCLENGIAYESGVCFVQKKYSIDVNTAYDKLINSNLYKNALQESKSRDLVKMRYDDTTQTWIFDISQENTPAPGCCRDQFEVSQEKVFYKRICTVNANATKYGYRDACADYYKNAFVQEEIFGTQSGTTNISITTGSEIVTGTELTGIIEITGTVENISSGVVPQIGTTGTQAQDTLIYTDETYGFTLQYPNTGKIQKWEDINSAHQDFTPLISETRFYDKDFNVGLSVTIYNTTYSSFEGFNKWQKISVNGNTLVSSKETTINKYVFIEAIEGDGIDSSGIYFYITHNNYTFSFRCDNNATSKIKILEILSTFNFTK